MPNSKRMDIPRGEDAAREYLTDTDKNLQRGPAPETIDRMLSANNRGVIGPRGMASFPAFQNEIYVGHIPTFVPVRGVVADLAPTVDDTAYIPAPQSGNPLP